MWSLVMEKREFINGILTDGDLEYNLKEGQPVGKLAQELNKEGNSGFMLL